MNNSPVKDTSSLLPAVALPVRVNGDNLVREGDRPGDDIGAIFADFDFAPGFTSSSAALTCQSNLLSKLDTKA